MRRGIIYIIVCVLAVAAVGFGISSLFYKPNSAASGGAGEQSTSAASNSQTAAFPGQSGSATGESSGTSASVTPPAGYLHYSNPTYHFSLWYPPNLQVQDYPESGGERTISFQNADNSQGFEIFIIPYTQSQVTKTRFQMDEPSGVMQNPTNITIAGAPATMFFGNNGAMGDTREVWFIHSGFLYEVATYKPLDSWLSQIMATWQFI